MTERSPMKTLLEPHGLECGTGVELTSWSGRRYALTFLAELSDTWIVRQPDGRLARLFSDHVDWRTLRKIDRPLDPALRPGDEVLLVSGDRLQRGHVERIGCDALHLLQGHSPRRVSRHAIIDALLLFRANELLEGDPFLLRSRNGVAYEGHACGPVTNGHVPVEFPGGARCSLRWSRIDPATLRLKVPVPLDAAVTCGSHDRARALRWRP